MIRSVSRMYRMVMHSNWKFTASLNRLTSVFQRAHSRMNKTMQRVFYINTSVINVPTCVFVMCNSRCRRYNNNNNVLLPKRIWLNLFATYLCNPTTIIILCFNSFQLVFSRKTILYKGHQRDFKTRSIKKYDIYVADLLLDK